MENLDNKNNPHNVHLDDGTFSELSKDEANSILGGVGGRIGGAPKGRWTCESASEPPVWNGKSGPGTFYTGDAYDYNGGTPAGFCAST